MSNEKLVTDIRNFRLDIDTYINTAKILPSSREISLAHTNLQRSKMWLGKCLAELGTANPYPESSNPENKVIEPQAEHRNDTLVMDKTNHISNVKMTRLIIQDTVDVMKEFYNDMQGNTTFYDKYFLESLLAMEESKMWLGMELDRIRETKTNPEK